MIVCLEQLEANPKESYDLGEVCADFQMGRVDLSMDQKSDNGSKSATLVHMYHMQRKYLRLVICLDLI